MAKRVNKSGNRSTQVRRSPKAVSTARTKNRPNAIQIPSSEIAQDSTLLEPPWCEAFLTALEITGVVTEACKAAGITRTTPYRYLRDNPEFETRWLNSERIANDALVTEARRRAIKGTQRPIYQRGELVGYETIYSDNLLLALLKAKFPEEYSDKFVIRLAADAASVLKFHGLTPESAWHLLLDELTQAMQQQQHGMNNPASIGIAAHGGE